MMLHIFVRTMSRPIALAALAVVLLPLSSAAADYSCFPSCAADDGRFLSIAGPGQSTFNDASLAVVFGVPSSASHFEFALFDGDVGGSWDFPGMTLRYTLFADPAGDGTGLLQLDQWTDADFADDAWTTKSRLVGAEAQAANGNYFYRLLIERQSTSSLGTGNFKIRTPAPSTLSLKPQSFAFIGGLYTTADRATIYPAYPALTPTTYDGTWSFFFRAPEPFELLEIWDGDMDFGSADCTVTDTDDPDTPSNVVPPWSSPGVNFEGVAQGNFRPCGLTTGSPEDDTSFALFLRSPSIGYSVVAPNGDVYWNHDPSGNLEWERFSIGQASSFAAVGADLLMEEVPAGIYRVRMHGVDLRNLNAWRLPETICVSAGGEPCAILCADCGTGTPGYWASNPQAWPAVTVTVGGVSYSRDEAIGFLMTSTSGDATFIMFRALVAAKLNVLLGTDPSCISATIAAADAWMADHGPVGSGVRPGGPTSPWKVGEPLATDLDRYDRGLLCAPSRDSLQ